MADGLLNKASIILTPTGYKAGTLYNVAPVVEPYEDFDFARTSTATRINSSGLVSNVATGVPRISYDSNGDNGHILLEPTSTNLVTYSEDFSQSTWSKINSSIILNSTTSPTGSTNATTLLSSVGTSEQYLDVGGLSVTSGEDYTMSCFVKKNSYDFFLIRFTGVGGAFTAGNVFFNINNGTLGTVDSGFTGTITDFGNGWYRCTATKSANSTTSNAKIRIQLASSDNTETITGDGTSGTFIFGAQFEELSYATSYIPTLTGSTETRATETATGAGSADLINSTEGVLYAEIAALADDGTARNMALSDGTTSNRIVMVYTNVSNQIRFYLEGTGGTITVNHTLTNSTELVKAAVRYKSEDFAFYINGVQIDTNNSSITFSGLNDLSFHNPFGGGSSPFYGKCKALAVFNEALSDSELTQLTT